LSASISLPGRQEFLCVQAWKAQTKQQIFFSRAAKRQNLIVGFQKALGVRNNDLAQRGVACVLPEAVSKIGPPTIALNLFSCVLMAGGLKPSFCAVFDRFPSASFVTTVRRISEGIFI
jgi:hypothetical protein